MKKKLVLVMMVCCIGLAGCTNNSDSSKPNETAELKEGNEEFKSNLPQGGIHAIKSITESESTISTTDSNKSVTEKNDYINNYLLIESATVKICEGYSGEEPGIENISIKNNGDRDIEKLIITVYFQDVNGKDIAEDSFAVIGGGYTSGSTLKSNYSWKMESDKYYPFKNLADEVDISRNRIVISEIEFGV